MEVETELEILSLNHLKFGYEDIYDFGGEIYAEKSEWFEKEINNHLLNERIQSDLQDEFALTTFQEINELDLANRELKDNDIFKITKELLPTSEIPINDEFIMEYLTDEPYPKYGFQPDTQLSDFIYIPEILEKLLNENIDFLEFENLCFYLQQPFYLTNELLPYYIDDDEADYYYQQVTMNPWLWAITQEGLSLGYLTEVEIWEY